MWVRGVYGVVYHLCGIERFFLPPMWWNIALVIDLSICCNWLIVMCLKVVLVFGFCCAKVRIKIVNSNIYSGFVVLCVNWFMHIK